MEETRVDVPQELATVGAAGAAALVASMVSDGWRGARSWVGRWLGRGRAEDETRQLARLDRDRELLLAAPENEADDRAREMSGAWAVRLQDVADEDEDAARELLDFVKRWQAENPEVAQKATVVRQNAKASGKARINQVGGNQTIFRGRS